MRLGSGFLTTFEVGVLGALSLKLILHKD